MRSNVLTFNWVSLASYAVGILTVILICLFLSGKNIPLIGNGKAAFILVWIMGFSMSVLAGFRDYPDGKFALPGFLMFFLMLLGFMAIVLFILMLIGVKTPFIPTYREAFIVLAGVIIIKWAAVHLYKLFHLLF